MNQKLVSNDELILSNMLEIQALIRIRTKRGITNEDEVMEEIKKLQVEMEEKVKKNGERKLITFS